MHNDFALDFGNIAVIVDTPDFMDVFSEEEERVEIDEFDPAMQMVSIALIREHHRVRVVRIVRVNFHAASVIALRAVFAVREHVARERTVAFFALAIHVRVHVVEFRQMLVETHVVVLGFSVVFSRHLR